jgi:hypothetical protein
MFQPNIELTPPSFRIEASETQRPVGHSHPCLPTGHQASNKNEAENEANNPDCQPIYRFYVQLKRGVFESKEEGAL